MLTDPQAGGFDEPDDDPANSASAPFRIETNSQPIAGSTECGALESSGAQRVREKTDQIIIDQLVRGRTQSEAGEAAGRGERTVRRRLRDPEFLEHLGHAREEHALRQRARSEALENQATAAIEELLGPDMDPSIRIRAANAALRWSSRVTQLEFEVRLAMLEDRMTGEENDK